MSFSNLDRIPRSDDPKQTQERYLFDNTQRYRFTNIDDEPFVGMWDGREFVNVPAGASVTLPEAQAITYAKELCTRVMFKEEKEKFVPNMREASWEESQKSRVGIPLARDPYEKRILQKLETGDETPELQAMRSEMREELMRDLSAKVETAPAGPPRAIKDLAVVKDKRTARDGHEFEGVKSLK